MKKRDEFDHTGDILMKVNDDNSGSSNGKHDKGNNEKNRGQEPKDIYMDTILSLMEKNRKRVVRYYCANLKCPSTFWNADLGYKCPRCGSLGIISEFRSGNTSENDLKEPIVGYLDSIGRIFCRSCAEHFSLGDDISFIIYRTSEPYRHESCEVCRATLSIPPS
jgi:hypothetical protein